MNGLLSYCGELVRERDNDRYLCALFTPSEYREDVLALLAFESEIARISHAVSEPMLGLIRLAWWREALEEIYAGGAVRHHLVVEALRDAIRRRRLPREIFEGMLNARERELEPTPFTREADWHAYCRATGGALHRMWATVAEVDARQHMAVESVGTAWSMVQSIGHVHAHLGRGHMRIAIEPGEAAETLAADAARLKARVNVALKAACDELSAARGILPKRSPMLLPGAFAALYLGAISSGNSLRSISRAKIHITLIDFFMRGMRFPDCDTYGVE